MIQRIQSIYLLLAAILMAVTAFSPLMTLASEGKFALTFSSLGIGNITVEHPTWGVFSMALLGTLFSCISIFMYKNRKKQVKIVQVAILIVVMFYITAATYLISYLDVFSLNAISSLKYGIILPILALIFQILAIGKIKKDDKLVRSLDRIR